MAAAEEEARAAQEYLVHRRVGLGWLGAGKASARLVALTTEARGGHVLTRPGGAEGKGTGDEEQEGVWTRY